MFSSFKVFRSDFTVQHLIIHLMESNLAVFLHQSNIKDLQILDRADLVENQKQIFSCLFSSNGHADFLKRLKNDREH